MPCDVVVSMETWISTRYFACHHFGFCLTSVSWRKSSLKFVPGALCYLGHYQYQVPWYTVSTSMHIHRCRRQPRKSPCVYYQFFIVRFYTRTGFSCKLGFPRYSEGLVLEFPGLSCDQGLVGAPNAAIPQLEVHLGRMIYRSFPLSLIFLDFSRQMDLFPIWYDLPELMFVGWDPYNLPGLAHVSCVGSCTIYSYSD